ncbi:MFS transporter [Arthrobacter antibioticus]|uniref:MFS transporter n=1 Tax=Arthrobacter sp. H35-MC1 TaxID=3046203 RepID=UPI0024B9F558|nr:MFS transporter [Arthrobacter sp. H35-MC1]MDJ0316309.1 MFS transporter [Arthrobacter sp. H35-MC1]
MASFSRAIAGKRGTAATSATAIVGFLVLVELTSGIIQGYYTPLLTDIARFLGIHDADVNWFEAAQLMVSALVVPVLAKMGDMIGHRKVLLISTALTAAASWGVAFAPNFWFFIIAWALQGFYVVWLPLEIALIYSRSHHRPDGAALTRRSAGILVAGLEFGVIVGALAGGFIGGALPDQLWLTLMIPAIAVTLCFFVILFGVPESESRTGGRLDIMGLTLLSTALLLITTGLTFMRINGPGTWWAWAGVVLGIMALAPFTRHELGHKDPLIDIRLLRQPSMWPIQLTAFLFGVSVLGAQAPLSTFARTDPDTVGYGLGASSGLVSILIGVYVLGLLFGALLYPILTKWTTPRITLLGAALLVAVGYLLFLPFHDSMSQVLLNMAIAGIGSGALVAALPSAAAAAAPLTQTGMAAGLTNATKTLGGAFASCIFGIALAGQALGSLTAEAGSTAAPLEGYMLVWSICGVTALVAALALYFVPKLAFGPTLPS